MDIYIEIKDIFSTNVQVIITVIEEQLFVKILIFVNTLQLYVMSRSRSVILL